jgi:glycosyltransferase involved in cell wall biosynthesis
MSDTLSIVVPAYNEEATLESVLRGCGTVFEQDARLAEIVVVDDRSTDRTAELARAAGAGDPRVKLLSNTAQMGCVPSVLRGFEAAVGEFVFFLPADGQILPDVVKRCLETAEQGGHDVVVTRRVDRQDPWYRVYLSKAYNRAIRLILPRFPATDIDSVCLFRRSVIAGHRRPEDATTFTLVELLLTAQRRGASIAEIEIVHHPRAGGTSTGLRLREIRDGVKGLLSILRWRLKK